MLIAALFTMPTSWKQLKCPSTGEWISKLWHIHAMEYKAIKHNKLLLPATPWMNLKCTLVSDRSHSKGYTLYDSIYTIFWKS